MINNALSAFISLPNDEFMAMFLSVFLQKLQDSLKINDKVTSVLKNTNLQCMESLEPQK